MDWKYIVQHTVNIQFRIQIRKKSIIWSFHLINIELCSATETKWHRRWVALQAIVKLSLAIRRFTDFYSFFQLFCAYAIYSTYIFPCLFYFFVVRPRRFFARHFSSPGWLMLIDRWQGSQIFSFHVFSLGQRRNFWTDSLETCVTTSQFPSRRHQHTPRPRWSYSIHAYVVYNYGHLLYDTSFSFSFSMKTFKSFSFISISLC